LGLEDFCRQLKIPLTAAIRTSIEEHVRNAAYEIIRGRGATTDGIGAAVADLLKCIVNDEHRILTVSIAAGTGAHVIAMSLPRIVGANGVVATLSPKMSPAESAALKKSGKIIQKNFSRI
jgi:L-lactate dehydrogenase